MAASSSMGVLRGVCRALAVFACACGEDETQRTLPPTQLALDAALPPVYDDGELTLYEVRRPVQLPIRPPSAAELARLEASVVPPYGRQPWVALADVRLQLSWTITNLDDEARSVEVLIDPWNEFARYFPGLMLIDADEGEYLPNLSGIDYLYRLEARSAGVASRQHGTYTFEDMDELARDFATVMSLIAAPPRSDDPEAEDLTLVYANHAFSFQNHSSSDALVKRWVPSIVPALTGFDVGLRTREPARIAIELVAEVVDSGGDKVQAHGGDTVLPAPSVVITLGSPVP